MTLSNALHPPALFRRSTQLERDFYERQALEDFQPTPRVQELAARILTAHVDKAAGAWCITGPYGAGKSTAALYIARDLDKVPDPRPRYVPLVVTARREPLRLTVLRALDDGIAVRSKLCGAPPPRIHRTIRRAHTKAKRGVFPSVDEVADLLSSLLEAIHRKGVYAGCLLVVDELGLGLDYAAHHPEHADVELLQILGELATRPKAKHARLQFVTILHQAFEDYARTLSRSERREWAKVQGRFCDVTLVNNQEEDLRLVSEAVGSRLPLTLQRRVTRWARTHAKHPTVVANTPWLTVKKREQLLAKTYPLNPVALLCLPALARRFAQSTRTLFGFLASQEPCSLRDCASRIEPTGKALPTVGAPQVFDYFVSSLNLGCLPVADQGLWCEVKDSVERAPQDLQDLAKTIGLLQLASRASPTLAADPSTIALSLWGSRKPPSRLSSLLGKLTKHGVATYRGHAGSYQLWRGSDFDVEAALTDRRRAANDEETIAFLNKRRIFAPIVAQRHSVATGTLRYFACHLATPSTLESVLEQRSSDVDGHIYILLTSPSRAKEAMKTYAPLRAHDALVGVPSHGQRILDVTQDLKSLLAFMRDTQVKQDTTALREIRERSAQVETQLRGLLRTCFEPSKSTWHCKGRRRKITSRRQLQRELSKICDRVYSHTPLLNNELINRRSLSSTSAAARGALLQRMLTHATQPRLGIEGFPPESSMYASLLERTGIHSPNTENRCYQPPLPEFPNLLHLWELLTEAMDGSTKTPCSIRDLYQLVEAPPFGVKAGAQPVLVLACYLSLSHVVALYENGHFLAALTPEIIERLVKKPEEFSVRRLTITEANSEVFAGYRELLQKDAALPTTASLLDTVRPLVSFMRRAPGFVQRTQRLPVHAKAVRKALLTATDPADLLLSLLPAACDAQVPCTASDEVGRFFNTLRSALRELRDAYPHLLSDLRTTLFSALNVTGEEARERLRVRAVKIQPYVRDTTLASLLLRLVDAKLDEERWTEAVGTLLVPRPVAQWSDADRDEFELRVREAARRFKNVERLTLAMRKHGVEDGARFTITLADGQEIDALTTTVPSTITTTALRKAKQVLSPFDESTRLEVIAQLSVWAMRERESGSKHAAS